MTSGWGINEMTSRHIENSIDVGLMRASGDSVRRLCALLSGRPLVRQTAGALALLLRCRERTKRTAPCASYSGRLGGHFQGALASTPLFIVHLQEGIQQAYGGVPPREDADVALAAANFLVEALLSIGGSQALAIHSKERQRFIVGNDLGQERPGGFQVRRVQYRPHVDMQLCMHGFGDGTADGGRQMHASDNIAVSRPTLELQSHATDEAAVVIGDDQIDAVQPAPSEPAEELSPNSALRRYRAAAAQRSCGSRPQMKEDGQFAHCTWAPGRLDHERIDQHTGKARATQAPLVTGCEQRIQHLAEFSDCRRDELAAA